MSDGIPEIFAERFIEELLALFEKSVLCNAPSVISAIEAVGRTPNPQYLEAQAGNLNTPGAVRYLERAITNVHKLGFEGVATALSGLCPLSPWKTGYLEAETGKEFLRNFAYATFIGPEGPFHSQDFAAGATIMGPNQFYDWHYHPAIEIYAALSPDSKWGVSYERPVPVEPGTVILHPSMVPHAMISGVEPLIAPWVWIGDIETPSKMTKATV